MKTQQKINYIQCIKQGYHFGEVLNMVCTQQSCLENLTCCCACIQQQHRTHNTKPLRMIMKQARTYSDKIIPVKFNIDAIIDIVNCNQKKTLDSYRNYKKEIIHNLDSIENSLISYFSFLIEQVKLKSCDPKSEIQKAFSTITNSKNIQDFKEAIKKIVAMLPNPETDLNQLVTESEFIQSITNSNQQINKMIKTNIEQVNKKLTQYQTSIKLNINTQNLWKKASYKFSQKFRHPDVKLINQLTVKGQNSSGYKFALLDWDLEKGSKIKSFAYKIKLSTSNWVSVGMCHKNIIVSKSYGFNFSSIGHGGYLISANGGSWSNTKTQANNCVKSFKFITNDIIVITVDFNSKKMIFKKKGQKHELDFNIIEGDSLYPCVLFYYMNDEIEFLPDYKDNEVVK